MNILAGDIGGTNSRLCMARTDDQGRVEAMVAQETFPSAKYGGFNEVIDKFLGTLAAGGRGVDYACFAVAGPVVKTQDDETAKITNLPWRLNARELAADCALRGVRLINDFEAIGFGIDVLPSGELVRLFGEEPRQGRNRIVLGAGTGLGLCQLIWRGADYQVVPTEGGHCDFAPTRPEQLALLQFLWNEYPHLSYDRLVSGPGIANIFRFLVAQDGATEQAQVREILGAADVPAAIAGSENRLAKKAMDMFVEIYGAAAGNAALMNLAEGGVFLAGGIAPKIVERLRGAMFREAFLSKGRMRPLLETYSVSVVTNPQVGLLGAIAVASRQAAAAS